MSQKHNSTYTLVFITIVSLISALLLSIAASALRDLILENQKTEVKKQILISLKAKGADDTLITDETDAKTITETFKQRITINLVNWVGEKQPTPENLDVSKLTPWRDDIETAKLPVYTLKKKGSDEAEAYSIPIWGKGLWGPIYGYLALEKDVRTVKGATFSAPKETPGLGAEIEKDNFRKQWVGKKIFAGEALKAIKVAKGAYLGKDSDYNVDGISGATLTCVGVTAMLDDSLSYYEAYLKTLKGGQK